MAKKSLSSYEMDYIAGDINVDKVIAAYRKNTKNQDVITLFDENGREIKIKKIMRMNETTCKRTKCFWWNITDDHYIFNEDRYVPNFRRFIETHLNFMKNNL